MRPLTRSSLALLVFSLLLLLGCNRGLPPSAGEYPVQAVTFDGREYSFYWAAPDGTLHQARGDDFKLVQDERSFLTVGQGTPVLHLRPDEPVTVLGRDRAGEFTSLWFPFLLGYALGGLGPPSGPPPTTPTYRYPPTDTFGRGDTLYGNEATARPGPPDYRKVQPAPNAVSGQNQGTGDGTAATNRAPAAVSGQSGGVGAGTAATDKGRAAISGQSGGSGAGSAATEKGGFAAGSGTAATDRGRTGRENGGLTAPPSGGWTSRPPGGAVPRPGASASGGGRRR